MSEMGETYEYLKKLSKKDLVDVRFSRYHYPDIIVDIKYNYESPSSSIVYFEFESNEDYFKVLGIDDEDDLYVWSKFMDNYYYDYDYDTYRFEEDWGQGYIIKDFDQTNINLVKDILRLVNPTLSLDINNDDSCEKVSKYLKNRFPDIDNIIYGFAERNQDCIRRAAIDVLTKETKNPFRKFGINESYGNNRFKTTIGVLLHWYNVLNVENLDISGLLIELLDKYDKMDRGGWYELEYNVWCDDFDNEGFQKETKRSLENIVEKLEEGLSDNEFFENYNELYSEVEKLGGFSRWINLPSKNSEVFFKNLDSKTAKLTFWFRKPDSTTEERSVNNIDDLNLSLYQPELFEQIKKIKSIIL